MKSENPAFVAALMFLTFAPMAALTAHAGIPQLNATCPGNLEVHADEGGPIYINGNESKLKKFNDNAFEATDVNSKVTISLTIQPDGTPDISYTGPGRTSGVCAIAETASATHGNASSETAAAESACVDAVARTTGVSADRLSVIDVLTAEAGIGVDVQVPGAEARWSCLSDKHGKVQGVTYMGSEGKL